jgi:hypothetical protein
MRHFGRFEEYARPTTDSAGNSPATAMAGEIAAKALVSPDMLTEAGGGRHPRPLNLNRSDRSKRFFAPWQQSPAGGSAREKTSGVEA